MQPFDYQARTRVVFGEGAVEKLGALARELGCGRALLVADRGLVASGHVEAAARLLAGAGVEVFAFHDFASNPDTEMVEAGRRFAAPLGIDSLVALGGGSSLDCAKAINFVLTNGGTMRDYWGHGKAKRPLLPMIGIPTTAGTGSEAQSYALISDAETHVKMACGDPGAAFRVAILDPALTLSQPPGVTAATGLDAISHAVETFVTTKRNPLSDLFSREAWRMLEANFERVLEAPSDLGARGAMLLGAFYAGAAVEHSMLGASHACANPLTARYGTPHGVAVALLLPWVVRWNAPVVGERYRELAGLCRRPAATGEPGESLARRLEQLASAGGLPRGLRAVEVRREDFPSLAEDAARQWTGTFNPRPFGAAGALEVYECAY